MREVKTHLQTADDEDMIKGIKSLSEMVVLINYFTFLECLPV